MEFSVDAALEKHLQTNETPPTIPAAKINDEDLVREPEPAIPCTEESRSTIYNMLNMQGMYPDKPNDLARLFYTIRKMNEDEAKAYVDGLQANRTSYFSKEASLRLIKILNDIVIHPNDTQTKSSIEADKLLVDEFAIHAGQFFQKLGKMRPIFLYGIYFFSSVLKISNGRFNGVLQTFKRFNNVTTPIQNDGGGKVSNG